MGIEAALIGGGLGLIGSSMQADAAQGAADSQAQAARIAAEAAAFRPVGLTTRFGRTGYTYDPQGNLIGAGYQVAPDVAAMREGMLGLAGGSLAQAQQARQIQPFMSDVAGGLFRQGAGLIPQTMDLGAASQDYMQKQQALLAPGREQQLAGVRNSLQQSGRAGLAFGATEAGRRAATNPEMAAYYNSIAQQDAQLAAASDQFARQNRQSDINVGLGLMGSGINTMSQGYGLQTAALAPWNSYMQGAQSMESLGANAMDMSSALGAKMSTAGANQAQYLNRTGTNTGVSTLGTGLMGLANNQQFTNGLSGWLSGAPTMAQTASTYGTNLGSQQTSMLNAQDAWFR